MYVEPHDSISATELVRNLPKAIDRVRFCQYRLLITRGNQTVAELRAPPKGGYPIAKLANLLSSLPTLGRHVVDMAKDQALIRHRAMLPDNPWDS